MNRNVAPMKDLQDDLHAHFRSLAKAREPSGFPIFALEHGLDHAERQRVNAFLRERHSAGQPVAPYWLLWAIYASEAGYEYEGDEYWPSFEKQIPKWEYRDRPKIKSCFRKFQGSFDGVEPSGRWAEHFSIIAWPITHALLPRYLQRQFAKLLYDLRFNLASVSLDAGLIGRLLAAHASHASTRFQAFLEQEELTGQIVAGLLTGESGNADDLIHSPTLRRIVADLKCVRNSREWLNETRRIVSDRFKGIGRGTYHPHHPPGSTPPGGPVRPDASRFVIRPDIFLRYAGHGKWSVLLQLKSLRPIAAENTTLRTFLDQTRCRLNGAIDWKPTGWLLSGNQRGVLRRWPDADTPLVQFEHANPLMDHLLESEYRLAPGPHWLFRIGSDGIARHIASCVVRPANDYILVAAREMPHDVPGSAPCALECEGVHAVRLTVPSEVPADTTRRLQELGINMARTIRVWSAGLPGRGWDGDGRTEWLTTESPCLGIASDHPIHALSFRLDDEPEDVVSAGPLGVPTFVQLPPLPAGNHLLTVEAHRSPELDDAVKTTPAKGFVKLAVREPEPWMPGVASHPGLIVTTDPPDTSLDTLWRNELNLSVNGPEGFAASVRLELHTADGRQVLSGNVDDSMALPITSDTWRRAFAHFLDNENRAWKYLGAASCTLEINGDSLGTCVLRFNHDPLPLRWSLSSRQRETFLRLVDDSGQHDTAPDVQFFNMNSPLISTPLDAEYARTDSLVPPPGGLYRARQGVFEDAAVVSAPHTGLKGATPIGLKDLGVEPDVRVESGLPAIRRAFCLLRIWFDARPVGFLVGIRQRQVTRSIFNAILRSICGKNWAEAEDDFAEGPLSSDTFNTLADLVDRRTDFGQSLHRLAGAPASDSVIAVRFAAEARRHGLPHDHDLCQFVLRVAARQSNALADYSDSDVRQLVDNPVLLRGARLISRLWEYDPDRLTSALRSNDPS